MIRVLISILHSIELSSSLSSISPLIDAIFAACRPPHALFLSQQVNSPTSNSSEPKIMAYAQFGRNVIRHQLKTVSDGVLHHPLFYAIQGVRYRKVEVNLTSSIGKHGKASDTVKVAPGFFRNHLMPKLLAVPNIDKYRHLLEDQRKIYQPKEDEEVKVVPQTKEDRMKEYQAAAKRLDRTKVVLRKFIKVDNEIREPATKEEIVAEVAKQLCVSIEPENLHLLSPLSSLGEFEVPLRLPSSIPLPDGEVQWALKIKIRRK